MKFIILILLALGIWIGLVLGLSFVEAPLKFTAPGITTELALGIGRLVFDASSRIQLILTGVIILSIIGIKGISDRIIQILFIILLIILLYQSLILLPSLDKRAVARINGASPLSSYHHVLFVILEIVKLILLVFSFIKVYTYGRNKD